MVNIPLEIIELQGEGYHLLIEIELFDKRFKMVVDTGASKTVLDKTTLIQSGIDEDAFELSDILSSGLGTNNMESFFIDIPLLKIGEWKIQHFPVAVLDLQSINYAYEQMNLSPVIGVLGGDILHNYNAVIRYRKKRLQLNNRKNKKSGN